MPKHPYLYEINALALTRRLARRYGKPVTLGQVPEEMWKSLAKRFDLVWLMGVWQRSPGARRKALEGGKSQRSYDEALPDWKDEDVAGSPYAVYTYTLDSSLGREGELAEIKQRLNRHGLGLVLDFVPNHLALDHPWTLAQPDRFIHVEESERGTKPEYFFRTSRGAYLAHGRDPYFPPWSDTAQVNFFSRGMREALITELERISEFADGVRCDMAMLALNEVFSKVWEPWLNDTPRPAEEFWSEAIGRVRKKRPQFLFIAEAYWNLEKKLQHLGFDFTYDKSLYDRLSQGTAREVREWQFSKEACHDHCAHFIENHDEPRALAAFGREKSRAAAMVIASMPGLRFFHDGQLEGKKARHVVQLGREREEVQDLSLLGFYDRLFHGLRLPVFREGICQPVSMAPAGEGNASFENLLACAWHHDEEWWWVVINYSPLRSQGRALFPLPPGHEDQVVLADNWGGETYVRLVKEIRKQGLYVELAPWEAHLFQVRKT
jgi:hypothetical protein